jgi:hypothetical protein
MNIMNIMNPELRSGGAHQKKHAKIEMIKGKGEEKLG